MDVVGSDVYKEVQKIFLNSQSILLLNHDLEKKNFRSNINITPEDHELKENACVNEATKLMNTYRSLEEHVLRLENSDSSSESNEQGIAARVKLAKGTFCSRVNNVINRLTQLLISLTSIINSTRHGSEVTLGRSWDLKDSLKRSIMKLQKQKKRWEKRIVRAGIKLSPDKSKIPDMGGKEIENKKKSDKEIVNAQPVTRWSGQPDKTG